MKTMIWPAVVAATLVLAAPAFAQDSANAPKTSDPVLRMNAAINRVATERFDKLLKPSDVLRMYAVAQQQALAKTCDGYEVDWNRYKSVMNDIVSDLRKGVKEGQKNLPVDVVMNAYSIVFGGQIAVAAYDKDAYCKRGPKIRAELEKDAEGRVTILAPAG